MNFISPSLGSLTFEEMFEDIIKFIDEVPDVRYKLIIGSDSQPREETCFVTAVIIHREGKGARYYYSKERQCTARSLRQRIFFETSRSLSVASRLAEMLAENGHSDLDVEIHLDIGEHGPSKELIREVIGMVVGSGFDACIKPHAYGASTVADKYTK